MNTLIINLLIVLFSLLILYNIIFRRSIVETMDSNDGYKDYSDDPNILAQQNAGNIKVLKDQMDKAMKIIDEIQPKQEDIEKQVESNTNSIQTIIQGQQDSVNQKVGMDSDPTPNDITGLD